MSAGVVNRLIAGLDLGGEVFLDITMRQAGLWTRCVVLVATARALASHGSGDVARGPDHLERQIANVRAFGPEPVVAVNAFADDPLDLELVSAHCALIDVDAALCTAFDDGGAGGEDLARSVTERLRRVGTDPPRPQFVYDLEDLINTKLAALATKVYGADRVVLEAGAQHDLEHLERRGYDSLPVCVAKTNLSFSDDPKAGGLARDFPLNVQEFRLAAGAGFVVALMGRIFTMPELQREPAAARA